MTTFNEEKINITIEEEQDSRQSSSRVKDIQVSLSLLNGYATHMTQKINGILDGCLISCTAATDIIISCVEHPIVIYRVVGCVGTQYVAIRQEARAIDGQKLIHVATPFLLNNKLAIQAKGAMNSKVDIAIRYT